MSSEQEVEAGAGAIEQAWDGLGVSPFLFYPREIKELARVAIAAAERVRAPKAFAADGTQGMRALHRARALQAIAEERCASDLTTGFCSPRDGKCQWEGAAHRACIASAASILRALETQGMVVVWENDPTLSVCMEKRP